ALGDPAAGRRLRFGGLMRRTERTALNRTYSVSLARPLPGDADAMAPEALFADYADAGDDYFRVVPLAAGGSYAAEDNLAAGYAMLATPLSRRFDLVAGARLERSSVAVASLSTAGEPSLA